MVVGLFFYHGRTNRRFVPSSPPWARLTSNRFTIADRWMVGMAYWVACLPSRHAVSFESNNRLMASPTSIRAIIAPAPRIDLTLTRHQGDWSGCTSDYRQDAVEVGCTLPWCRLGVGLKYTGWKAGRRRHARYAEEVDVGSSRMTGRCQSESW